MGGNYERGIYNHLMDVMSCLEQVEAELQQERREHKEDVLCLRTKIAKWEEANQKLRAENELLRNEIARLKSIINNDSTNTSLPPSSDQNKSRAANTFNSRGKGKRKAGGQKGHKGVCLSRSDVEEKIRSGKCRHEIKTIGDIGSGRYKVKYVIDLDVEPVITEVRIYANESGKYEIPKEYANDVSYGAKVKALCVCLYSEGVMSNDRIASFLNGAGKGELGLSEGSVYNFCRCFGKKAEVEVAKLEEEQLNQEVVCSDATTVKVNGEQCYIRNFSTSMTVIYRAMRNKGLDALKKLEFLKRFAGTFVHDHETAMYHFGTRHGECNVHIIRYLRKNTEDTGNEWSSKMISALCEMNEKRKEYMRGKRMEFSDEQIREYEQRYHEILSEGREQNKNTRHEYARQDEKALLNRMENYSENHLLFLHDFKVPFDNNMSERDLRKVKNRQKMAGGFRKDSGHEMYCAILSFIETMKRRGRDIIDAILELLASPPSYSPSLLGAEL